MPRVQEELDKTCNKEAREMLGKLNIRGRDLEGGLKLEDFVKLKELDCSNNKITSLEIVNCPSLERIICSENKLEKLSLGNLEKLEELYCSKNQLTKLNLQGCIKLKKFYYYDNPLHLLTGLDFGKNKKLRGEILEESKQRAIETRVKNILLIGRTGGGKSTLANILSRTNEFRVSSSLMPVTKEVQVKEFELNNQKYKVIDTVGFDDPNLNEREVASKIVEAY